MGFVVNQMEMGQGFLRVLWFFTPVSIIPPLFHTHCSLSANVTRGTSGRSKRIFNEVSAVWDSGEHWRENTVALLFKSSVG